MREPAFENYVHRSIFVIAIALLLWNAPLIAQTSLDPETEAWATRAPLDENRLLLPERVPAFVDRFAYTHDASIAELLSEARLRLIEDSVGVWLQRSEKDVSVLVLGVTPIDDSATRTLLVIISAGGSDYPILTDAPLGNGSLRLQLLGTNEAIAVSPASTGGYQISPTAPFDPVAKNEMANGLRRVRSEGLGETLSCLAGVLFSTFSSWSDFICAVGNYTICVTSSAGVGLVGCAVAFVPDCATSLSGLASCFSVATDTSLPSINFGQPASGATVNGTSPITANIYDNALRAVAVHVDYQTSSGARRIVLVGDNNNMGGCSLSSTSATCATQFNFGQAVNGSTATIRITASDTAGNLARASRNVIVSTGPITYSISGNAGQSGVGITGCSQSTQTDANGNYTLNGCVAGTHTITPSKSGCTFSPPSRSVTVGPSATGMSFSISCGGTATPISNGQTLSSLSSSAGVWRHYKISVPSGQTQLKIMMSGGTGDADLYVRRGASPTTSLYDHRPYLGGNNETVTVTNPASGDWYIGIYAYIAYSGVSLNATYTGAACTSYSGSLAGTGYVYYLPSSSGYASAVSGTHTGKLTGTGLDFDLYLQKYINSTWTTVSMSAWGGSTENVSYAGTSGTYRWRVYSYSGSGTFNLCVTKP